jgi:hypothetical protein
MGSMIATIEIKLGHIIEQKIAVADRVLDNALAQPVPVWLLLVDTDRGTLSAIVPSRETAIVKASDLMTEMDARIVHIDDEPENSVKG